MSIPDRFTDMEAPPPPTPRQDRFKHADLRVFYSCTCLTSILANHPSINTKRASIGLPLMSTICQRTLVSNALHGVDPRDYTARSSQQVIASPQNCQNILIPKLSTDNAAIFWTPTKHPNVAPDPCVLHFHTTSIRDWCIR